MIPTIEAQWVAQWMAIIALEHREVSTVWGEWRVNDVWYWLDRIESGSYNIRQGDGRLEH